MAGQEYLTNFDSYCNSTLHTPRRYSRDFWLLCDCCCCFVGRFAFSLELVTKEQRRELGKKMPFMNSKNHVVVGKGKDS